MRKVNGIYVTKCVSFPRSGQQWLSKRLRTYFGEKLSYCEPYLFPEKVIDVCPNTNYQKTHDFELKEPIDESLKHIVQIRNFEDACLSYYRLTKLDYHTYSDNPIGVQKPTVDVLSEDYINWQSSIKVYYDKFVDKWINSQLANTLVIRYEDMLNDPVKEMSSVISFITDDDLDLDRLKWYLRFDGQTK